MNRYFDLYLTAGHSVPVVINCNQYDSSETWIFTLYTEDDQLYTPASGSIVGLKSDGHTIANAGTVNSDGQVVIQETVQITAAKGINVFELVLDGNHGTANFVVLVEPRPGDNVTPSDSELTLMEQAIAAAGSIGSVSALTDIVNSVNSRMDEFIADHAGLSSETVLWTGELYKTYVSPATTPTGGKATLSQNVTDFDYIGVYTTMNTLGDDQTAEVHWYNADDFAENPTMVTCGTTKAYSSTTDWIAIPYITLLMDSDEVTCTVFNAGLVSWNGQAESNATSQTSEGTTNYQGSVVKIVGIKNTQNDTEVIDARVGADGTVYNTLEARLNAENSALKSQIQSGGGFGAEVKTLLESLFSKLGCWLSDPTDDLTALHNALFPPANLSSISAVYTQSGTVYDTDTLDSLKADLVVTAHYSDSTSETVSSYTLSGVLTEGTSTITVSYGGKSTTFNVTVSSTAREAFEFENGYSVGVDGNTHYATKTAATARATTATPIPNLGYVFTSTDSTKYQVNAIDVTQFKQPYNNGYPTGGKTIAWGETDSANTAFVWLALKKVDGTDFTTEELANGASSVFTFTTTNFGTFANGYTAIKTSGGDSIDYRKATAARATTPLPVINNNYVVTVTDSSKYNILVQGVQSLEKIEENGAADGYGFTSADSTAKSWATQDSSDAPYIWICLKKMDGTAFTDAELANDAQTVFTYTEG